jgi:phage-related minor tail protein
MTDDVPTTPAPESPKSEIEKVVDEFREQMKTMKSSFEENVAKLTAENESLRKANEELTRSLVRTATVPDDHGVNAPEKSLEEQYQDRVKEIAEKALKQVII